MPTEDDAEIDTIDAFRRELGRVLEEAHRNGVDVEGGWDVTTEAADAPNWDVELWRVRNGG